MPACLRAFLPAFFPIALLLVSAWFFRGHLGWWSDDHWHNQRHTITDAVSNLTIQRGFFLRPLFYLIVPAITTLTWHHDWIAHTLQVLCHAAVVLLLWRFMLALGLSRRASAAAALLFMVFPPQFEALFWVSATPTVIAAGLMLAIFFLTMAFARGRGWWTVALMPPLTFALCCLNEQPAAGIMALPLVYLAARRDDTPIARALIPPLACGLAAAVYLTLVRLDAPPGSRGSAQNLVRWEDLPKRIDYFATVLWRRLYMRNFARGALSLGWEQIRAAGAVGWASLTILAATGAAWAWRWATSSSGGARSGLLSPRERMSASSPTGEGSISTSSTEPPRARARLDTPDPVGDGEQEPPPPRRLGTSPEGGGDQTDRLTLPVRLLLGPILFLSGCLPILVLANYDPDSRTRYWPCIGAAILLAALGTAAARLQLPRPAALPLRLLTAAFLLTLLLTFATMLVGIQAAFRARHDFDRRQGDELRSLIPDPVPYSFVVPLNIEPHTVRTGSPVLDTHLRSVWEFAWTTPNHIQRVYRRDDVRCGFWRHWTKLDPVLGGDARGLHYRDTLGPRFPEIAPGVRLIPWDRAIPFTIGRDGKVRLATAIALQRPGEPDLVIPIPQAPANTPALVLPLPRL